ncbi:MAG: DUF1538 domain-containing protein [Bacillota bacterium]
MNFMVILEDFDAVLVEILTAISPVLILFLLFIFFFKMPRQLLFTLAKGGIFAFCGLALFLQGVKVGFMPVGMEIGSLIGALPNRWILIPLGFFLGFLATLAEPAVRILSSQVEKGSSGAIRSSIILLTLCFAVGLFIALGMTRIVYGIPFQYIIIPGYLIAMILMFLSKPSFTSIAFDSGGVATGPMTVTFIMAMAVGAADVIEGRDAVIDGFGLIALVALAPIIMIMLIGFLYPDDSNTDNETDNGNNSSEKEETEPEKAVIQCVLADQETEEESAEEMSVTEGINPIIKETVKKNDTAANNDYKEEMQDETSPET